MDATINALVVAPHADDEVFGCGGTIAKWSARGVFFYLAIMTIGTGGTDVARYNQCLRSSALLGIQKTDVLCYGKDSFLDTVPQADFVKQLDKILDERVYNWVFIPYPSQHKDHKVTHEICLAALRLGQHEPCNVLMYEYTYPYYDIPGGKLYVDISSTIAKKLQALGTYKACLRNYPHPASYEAMQIVAKMRGYAIQVNYAEMFHVIQMLEY